VFCTERKIPIRTSIEQGKKVEKMRIKRSGVSVVVALTLSLPVLAVGDEICNLTGTGASTVQVDAGQGNYVCELSSTANGPMTDVTGMANITRDNANGYISWTFDDPSRRIYTASVYTGGKGARCNYQYSEKISEGDNLGDGTPSNKDILVTLCAAPDDSPAAGPDIIDTQADGCTASFSFNGITGKQFQGAIGLDSGGPDTNAKLAICASSTREAIDKGLGQKRCVGGCVPREIPEGTDCAPLDDGSIPLACAPCEWQSTVPDPYNPGENLKYCWYWQNRVCDPADIDMYLLFPGTHYCYGREGGPDDLNCTDSEPTGPCIGTFTPKSTKNKYIIEVEEYDGSTCRYWAYGKWNYYSC
jgi:hypothetical protein